MKTITEQMDVMQTFIGGCKIQTRRLGETIDEWKDITVYPPLWNWADYDYRVKPEPRLGTRTLLIKEESRWKQQDL